MADPQVPDDFDKPARQWTYRVVDAVNMLDKPELVLTPAQSEEFRRSLGKLWRGYPTMGED